MRTDFDVAVLGAGIAGAAAALAASDAGARVCVIAGPPGSSALFSGAWRGAPPESFRAHLARAGYELRACEHPLPHPHGGRSACHSATLSHQSAQLNGPALVCGIVGLPGFDASALARSWQCATGAAGEISAISLQLSSTPRAGWSPASLAACLERDSDEIAHMLADHVRPAGASRVILPAVLGLEQSDAVHTKLQQAVGAATLGEALGVPPSLPGWRLQHALTRALRSAGVHSFSGRARLADRNGAQVQSLTLDGATVRAHRYVLATGKFVAGGIEADGVLREPAFDCPVWIEHLDNVFTTPEPLMLTDAERTEPQPLLQAGVHTDAAHRPVNRDGDVVYENLFIAGSVRADWDSASHGAGHCASDGWSAGQQAVQP